MAIETGSHAQRAAKAGCVIKGGVYKRKRTQTNVHKPFNADKHRFDRFSEMGLKTRANARKRSTNVKSKNVNPPFYVSPFADMLRVEKGIFQEPRKGGFSQRGFLQNPVSPPRKQKLPEDIGPGTTLALRAPYPREAYSPVKNPF